MQILKSKFLLSTVLVLIAAHCRAQVYSVGAYSFGTTYFTLSSTSLPFPPYKYTLTKVSWSEDANGFTITDVYRKAALGDVSRRELRVECGSETFIVPPEKFTVPLDDGPSRQAGSRDSLPVGKGSGDLAQLVTQITTNRGGRVTTNALPAVKMSWLRQSRLNQDIIIVDGDHFTEVEMLLDQAYGKPDATFSSLAHVNGCSVTYTPAQIGVVLNLTGGLGMTIVSVIGK
jgi:hypothetical protein